MGEDANGASEPEAIRIRDAGVSEAASAVGSRNLEDALVARIRAEAGGRAEVWAFSMEYAARWEKLVSEPLGPQVVVWDGPARDHEGVAVRKALTPVTWAVAANHVACRSRRPMVPVLVVALGSWAYRDELAALLRNMPTGRRPWFRMPDPADLARVLNPRAFESSAAGQQREWTPEARASLKQLRAVVQEDLFGDDDVDYHDVANLVGPLLLIDEPLREDTPRAIRDQLRALALLPVESVSAEPEEGAGGQAQNPTPAIPPVVPGGSHLLLVDDDWGRGWARYVAQQHGLDLERNTGASPGQGAECAEGYFSTENLGQAGAVRVGAVASSPWILLEALRKVVAEGCDSLSLAAEGKVPQRSVVSRALQLLGVGDGATPGVLLLDLRLFSRDAKAEQTFLRELATEASGLIKTKARDEAHEQLVETSEVVTWFTRLANPSGFRRDQRYLRSLCFLPQILALVDPATPIVIFSSARQAVVYEALKSFPNVVTDFHKPRVDGRSAASVRESTHAALAAALRRARVILEARRRWTKACRLE